jgi:hypothetical protein
MTNITPKTVLISLGKTIATFQKRQYRKATEYAIPTKTIMVYGDTLMNVDYTNYEHENEVKQVLFQLQKYGYVRSELTEGTTRIRDNARVTYKQRNWYITEKGIEKLRELARK